MAYNTFPTFTGRGWDIIKRPTWNTIQLQAASGAEYRTQVMQYPIYEFEITVPYLSLADWQTLIGFYNQQGGSFLPFYFTHDNDNSATAVAFGVGNGTLTAFQIVKKDGVWSEPVAALNGTPTIYAAGTQILATGTGTPAAPTLNQTAGGTKAARTYYARITYVDAAGNESNSSTEANFAVALNNLLTVASPTAVQGAVSWNLYLNTATNTEKFQVTTAIGTGYTEPTTALSFTGAAYPTTDGTPYSVSLTSGLVTFQHAPANTITLTWTGSYYYLVRFKDDQIDLSQFMSNMFESKGILLRSVR